MITVKHLPDDIGMIKSAVDLGLDVRCANGNYQVIRDSAGQYLIKYLGTPADYIGLHGREGTQYADKLNHSDFRIVTEN